MKLKDGHGPSGGDSRRRVLQLAGFANAVLRILEKEWSPEVVDRTSYTARKQFRETLEEISRAAVDWRLAKFNDGDFETTPHLTVKL